jgi:ubiquinone/menaquinone biosynthesis C-methylase UbiE
MSAEALNFEDIWYETSTSLTTGRGGEYVIRLLEIAPQLIEGKRILDIGAGQSSFTQIAKGLGARNVVAFDPKYSAEPGARPYPARGDLISGVAQMLPFKDGSFDFVTASYSFYWIREGLFDGLSEVFRVLSPGGTFIVHPIAIKDEAHLPSGAMISSERGSNDLVVHIQKPLVGVDKTEILTNGLYDALDFAP